MSGTTEGFLPETIDAGDDGADLFFKHLTEEPKKAPEAAEEAPATETTEEPVKAAEEAPEAPAEDDEPEVELPFGEELKKFKLKDVREAIEAREANTTRAAEAQKALTEAAERSARAQTALDKMIGQAKERYAPYANVDWLALSRDPAIDHASFVALREDAQKAHGELTFLENELGVATQQSQQVRAAAQREAATAAIAVLTDPVKGIKGFGPQLYGEIMKFAADQGMPEAVQSTSPAAIRLLHNAMLYQQGLTKAAVQVTKVVHQPTKIIRPSGSKSGEGASKLTSAMAALRQTGSQDAATAAFAAHLNG